jgi:hypothetical protein
MVPPEELPQDANRGNAAEIDETKHVRETWIWRERHPPARGDGDLQFLDAAALERTFLSR